MNGLMSDHKAPAHSPIGESMALAPMTEAERAASIDALMALPIKQPPQITIFGDDDVVGINPAPLTATT